MPAVAPTKLSLFNLPRGELTLSAILFCALLIPAQRKFYPPSAYAKSRKSLIIKAGVWYFTCHYPPSAALRHHTYVKIHHCQSAAQRRPSSSRLVKLVLLATVVAAASMGAGCSGSGAFRRSQGVATSSSGPQQLPFHNSPESVADDNSRPAIPGEGLPISTLPSAMPNVIPSGTLVTVRLDDPMRISRVHPGDSFTACLANPLMLGGETLARSGDPVNGRIEWAQPSVLQRGAKPVAGYVRLTLTTISVDHRAIPVQTSSLFARAEIRSGKNLTLSNFKADRGRIQKGRLLTFRLNAPLSIAEEKALARR